MRPNAPPWAPHNVAGEAEVDKLEVGHGQGVIEHDVLEADVEVHDVCVMYMSHAANDLAEHPHRLELGEPAILRGGQVARRGGQVARRGGQVARKGGQAVQRGGHTCCTWSKSSMWRNSRTA